MIKEIRMGGTGGQGLILAGLVLAEAAGIYEGKEVIQVQEYGGAMRGGSVLSEILIGLKGENILFPAVTKADILLALSQEAADRWTGAMKKDGCILYDVSNVRKVPPSTAKVYPAPITEMTKKKLGGELGVNMVALGMMREITEIVSREALEWAVLQKAPKGSGEFNLQALRHGFVLAKETFPSMK
jgi:2-oxoglutarate ferredoxin oxidoreductase subunit gamma